MKLDVMPIDRVVRAGLCSGCGACAAVAPEHVRMVDRTEQGRRPVVGEGAPQDALIRAAHVCPGSGLRHNRPSGVWGPVLEVWQGYAADAEVRHTGSSGGLATALGVYCLEHAQMYGVLHTAARTESPHLNETVMSTTRQQLLARSGSRYAPASPCEGLGQIEHAPASCVFVGKPCDVAGARSLALRSPGLARRLGLTISIFCAGTPTTRGTLEMLSAMGIGQAGEIRSLRYRGNGWPGDVRATRGDGGAGRALSYEQAWGEILTNHKQWRCKLCADHTGEFADLAVGDAWHLRRDGDEGRSIVVVRTERGRRILHAAIASGDVMLERVGMAELRASQSNLETTRGAVWGRIFGARLAGCPAPRYRNMPMLWLWLGRLSLREKARSIAGACRRARAAREDAPNSRPPGASQQIEPKKYQSAGRVRGTAAQGVMR